jgi:hypothetical protein
VTTLWSVLRQPALIAVTGKFHGLGNRVRVVLGCRSLAALENRRLFYTWPTGVDFGARFNELWQFDDSEISTPLARLLSLRYPNHPHSLEWLTEKNRKARVWLIRTPHALHLPSNASPWERELQNLRPVQQVEDRVRNFFGANLSGEPYVGVMVRAHEKSHAVTLRESPIEWYLRRMRDVRSIHPDMRFFVSSDSSAAEQRILAEIPGSFSLPEKGAYNSREALQSAVADLYLLASSAHILAPHFSSFPELAQKLAGPSISLETSKIGSDLTLEKVEILTRVSDPTRPYIRLVP